MNTRRACSLYRFVLPYLSSFTIFAVLASGQFARAAERAITVNVDPGKTKTQNVGCGFNDLSDAVYELTIEVTSQYTIVETGIDEQAGDSVLWQARRERHHEVPYCRRRSEQTFLGGHLGQTSPSW